MANTEHPKIKADNVIKGAAAVTVAAGVVAAGVLLSDKKNRKKAGKMLAKGIKAGKEIAQEIGDEAGSKYQAIGMNVQTKKIPAKSSRSKKTARIKTKS